MSYDIYTGLLKTFPLPKEKRDVVMLSYDMAHPQFVELKAKYPIEAVAGGGDDFSKAINLLQWVSSNIYHRPNLPADIPHDALHLLDYGLGKGADNGFYCVALSKVLVECLLAIGIKARQVFIMPCSPYDYDNHVVAEAYVNGKWMMLCPTNNLYFKGENDETLGILELRDYLADQKPVFVNSDAKYNDDVWTDDTTTERIEYFAKNLFYFQLAENNTFGAGRPSEACQITLCPAGYDPKHVRVSNLEYNYKKWGPHPEAEKWLKLAKEEKYIFCCVEDFNV